MGLPTPAITAPGLVRALLPTAAWEVPLQPAPPLPTPPQAKPPPLILSSALPPVPAKAVEKIQNGNFIDFKDFWQII